MAFFSSCPQGVWSPGLLADSRCIITSNQAILQSVLPSGRMALCLLRCLRGLLQGKWEVAFPKPWKPAFTGWVWNHKRKRLCRITRSSVQSHYSNVSLTRVCIVLVFIYAVFIIYGWGKSQIWNMSLNQICISFFLFVYIHSFVSYCVVLLHSS